MGGGNLVAGTSGAGLTFRPEGDDDLDRIDGLGDECLGGVGRGRVGGGEGEGFGMVSDPVRSDSSEFCGASI